MFYPKSECVFKKSASYKEAKRISNRIGYFDINNSVAYKILKQKFSGKISHEELRTVAEILAKHNNIHIDRDAKRNKMVLIKWFDENWAILRNQIDKIYLLDNNFNVIG